MAASQNNQHALFHFPDVCDTLDLQLPVQSLHHFTESYKSEFISNIITFRKRNILLPQTSESCWELVIPRANYFNWVYAPAQLCDWMFLIVVFTYYFFLTDAHFRYKCSVDVRDNRPNTSFPAASSPPSLPLSTRRNWVEMRCFRRQLRISRTKSK